MTTLFLHRLYERIASVVTWMAFSGCVLSARHLEAQIAVDIVVIGFFEGEPRLMRAQVGQWGESISPRLEMLGDEEVQRELGFVPDQAARLNSLGTHRLSKPSIDSTTHLMQRQFDREKNQELVKAFREEIERLENDYADLVLPHQSERLDELQYRLTLEQKGLFVFVDELAREKGLSLPATEIDSIKSRSEELAKKLHTDVIREYRDTIQRVSEKCPDCSAFLDGVSGRANVVAIDVLVAEIPLIPNLARRRGETDFRKVLTENRSFRLNRVGNWEAQSIKLMSAFSGLLNLVKDLRKDPAGIIGEDQAIAIDALDAQYSAKWKATVNEDVVRIQDGVPQEEAYRIGRQERERLSDLYLDKVVNEVLLPPQRDWLISAFRERERKSYGLLGILLLPDGATGGQNAEKSSKDDRRKILEEETAAPRGKIRDLYEESIAEQVELLPEALRPDVKRALGDRPEFMVPNLSIVLGRFDNSEYNPYAEHQNSQGDK